MSDSILTRARAFGTRVWYFVIGMTVTVLLIDKFDSKAELLKLRAQKVETDIQLLRAVETLDRSTATANICLVALQDLRSKVEPAVNQVKDPDPEPVVIPRRPHLAKFDD